MKSLSSTCIPLTFQPMKSFITLLLLIAVVPFSTATDNSDQLALKILNENNDHVQNAAVKTSTISSSVSSIRSRTKGMTTAIESSNIDDRSLSNTSRSGRVTLESMQTSDHFLGAKLYRSVFSRQENFAFNDSRNWKIIPLQDDKVQIESIRFPGYCLMNPTSGKSRIRIRGCSTPKVFKRKWKIIELGNDIVAFESIAFKGLFIDNNYRTRGTFSIELAKFKITNLD